MTKMNIKNKLASTLFPLILAHFKISRLSTLVLDAVHAHFTAKRFICGSLINQATNRQETILSTRLPVTAPQ